MTHRPTGGPPRSAEPLRSARPHPADHLDDALGGGSPPEPDRKSVV